jgi:hypothetical protein
MSRSASRIIKTPLKYSITVLAMAFLSVGYAHAENAPATVADGSAPKQDAATSTSTSDSEQAKKDNSDKSKLAGSRYFFFHTGATVLSPYKIAKGNKDNKEDPNKVYLQPTAGSDSGFFLEGVYRKRAAWLGKEWLDASSGWLPLDVEFKFGAVSGQKADSAATVAGTGDAYAEITLGLILEPSIFEAHDKPKGEDRPRLRKELAANGAINTFNLELIAGINTERAFLKTHSYLGAGLSWVWGIPVTIAEKKRMVEMQYGFYGMNIDVLRFAGKGPNDNIEVKVDSNFSPAYEQKLVGALRSQVNIPVGQSGLVTFSGQLFADNNGGNQEFLPWSFKFGLTLPLDKVVSSITTQ